jgi:UDP-glucose 4-epimerase
MKVTVTGGAGFIGANLCRALVKRPDVDRIVVIDDLSSGSLENLDGLDVDVQIGSFLEPDLIEQAVAGSDAVVHLGARPSVPRSLADPIASHEVNATGTLRVLEAARAQRHPLVIVASSSSVYGGNPALPKHEDLSPMPLSPYAASKLAAESYALAYQESFGVPVLPLRFFNVFGPLQQPGHAYAAAVPAFIWAALHDTPLPMNGDGRQSRDFTYVDSVTTVIAEAISRRVTSARPVNLAFGTRTDLLGLVAALEEVLGRPLEIEHAPPRTGDVRHSQADSRALRSLFPEIEPVELHEGLRRTVDWMSSLG